jgi:nucleoprotein TPR
VPQPADVLEVVAKRVAEVTAEFEAREAALKSSLEEAHRRAEETAKPSESAITSTLLDELKAQHAEELRSLEIRLKEQHSVELQAAVESALESVAKEPATISAVDSASSGVAPVQPPPNVDIDAIVQERLAAEKAVWEADKESALSQARAETEEKVKVAKENVAKEVSMKANLKDRKIASLVKELAEVKGKLESQSNVTAPTSLGVRVAAAPASSIVPGSAPIPAKPAPMAARGGAPPAGPSRGGPPTRGGAPAKGRGRGGPVGGGVALGRTGSQILQTVAEQIGAGTSSTMKTVTAGQTSILGAAGAKRPRESDADAGGSEVPKRPRGGGPPSIIRPTRSQPPPTNEESTS